MPVVQRIWTIPEHGEHPVGDGDGEIPPAIATRLHDIAAASPLAGRSGEAVLSIQQRKGRLVLKARHVVGVVAADGHALEILPKIGSTRDDSTLRQRLVHMIADAHDLPVAAQGMAAMGTQPHDLLEVLIGLFLRQLADAARKGMPRRYIAQADDLPVLRGRLDLQRQFTTLAANPARLACRFDELSADIALNRIIKAALGVVRGIARLPANRRSAAELGFLYADITPIAAAQALREPVVLDRTNSRWRNLLAFSRLLLAATYHTTSAGRETGHALLFTMHDLFERFVAARLRRALAAEKHLRHLAVRVQGGRRYCLDGADGRPLFQTRPDILVLDGRRILAVLDTKWKPIGRNPEDRKRGVREGDIYQMMAYGALYGHADNGPEGGHPWPALILVYPRDDATVNDLHAVRVPHARGLRMLTLDLDDDLARRSTAFLAPLITAVRAAAGAAQAA